MPKIDTLDALEEHEEHGDVFLLVGICRLAMMMTSDDEDE